MSWKVLALVYEKRFGSVVRKAVMTYFADKASDDGSGIWASKRTIAAAIEAGRSTVIRTVNDLEKQGILIRTGTRECTNGSTVEYRIDLAALTTLPPANDPQRVPVPDRDRSRVRTGPRGNLSQSETPQVPERDPNQSRSGTQTFLGTSHEQSSRSHSSARAHETDPDNQKKYDKLLADVIGAVGRGNSNLPRYWLPNVAGPHVWKWHTELGLTHDEIVSTARQSKQQHPDPPDGPKALDRAMQTVARAKADGSTKVRNRGISTTSEQLPVHRQLRAQPPKEFQNEN